MSQRIEIMHVPLTTPCPVPVTPRGETLRDGEPIPLGDRTELCAVDAAWLIGAQRCCDIHLRGAFELGAIAHDGTVDDAIRELLSDVLERPCSDAELARFNRPWTERSRYPQEEARQWHEDAKAHGLA